jgi:hypothetical protein
VVVVAGIATRRSDQEEEEEEEEGTKKEEEGTKKEEGNEVVEVSLMDANGGGEIIPSEAETPATKKSMLMLMWNIIYQKMHDPSQAKYTRKQREKFGLVGFYGGMTGAMTLAAPHQVWKSISDPCECSPHTHAHTRTHTHPPDFLSFLRK